MLKLDATTLGKTSSSVNARFTGGYVAGDLYVRHVFDEMMRIEPYQFPLVNFLFLSKAVKWRQTANIQGLFEFPEKEMVPNMTTVLSGGTAGSATIVITVDDPELFIENKAVLFEDTDEMGVVTSISGNNITITKIYTELGASQTWTTAPTVGTNVWVLGEAMGEDDSTPDYIYTDAYMRKSRVQLFEKSIKMSDILIAATKNGGTYGGNWFTEEMREKAIEQKRDMEMAFWLNKHHSLMTSSNKLKTLTEGVFYTILNRGGFTLPYGSKADKATIKQFLRMSKRGSKKKTWFVGDELMADIEDFIEEKYYNTQPVARYGPIKGDDVINVMTVRIAGLVVDIIRNPMWEGKYAGYGALLDDNHIYGAFYAPDNKGSRKWRIEQGIAPNGEPREDVLFLSHVGIGLAAAPVHGLLLP